MLYYFLAILYFLIFGFTILKILIYFFRSKVQAIYINKNLLVLPIFLIAVSSIVAFSGLTKANIESYDSQTIIIFSSLVFVLNILGSVLVYLIVSWKVTFEENYLLYSCFKRSDTKLLYSNIKFIDAFRPSSNGIIHIVSDETIIKINHNFIEGDISSLTRLVSKYRKAKQIT
jgi:hypothetical protein